MNAALASLNGELTNKSMKQAVELLKILRAHFADEHVDVVCALMGMAPNYGKHTMRLPRAAYRKGLLAALSYDSMDDAFPECPYDRTLSQSPNNRLHGRNDPHKAWRDGSKDGQRIRSLVLCHHLRVLPPLAWREYKVLTPAMQKVCDAVTLSLAPKDERP